jgi:hypothetical protein
MMSTGNSNPTACLPSSRREGHREPEVHGAADVGPDVREAGVVTAVRLNAQLVVLLVGGVASLPLALGAVNG